jgi:hypothetical protein
VSHLRRLSISIALAGALTTAGITPALAATGTSNQPGTPGPATTQAIAHPNVDPGTVIAVAQKLYGIYKSFTGGGSSAQLATQQIIDAINSSRTAIISQIDAVAAADVRACAQSAVINFNDFNALSPDNQQAFALSATNCVTQADSLLSAVTDKAAKDQLGFALNTVGPIALMARVRAGLTTTGLTSVLKDANQTVYNQLIPGCGVVRVGGYPVAGTVNPYYFVANCSSYNQDYGRADFDTEARANAALPALRNTAGRNTSWLVAEDVLPQL